MFVFLLTRKCWPLSCSVFCAVASVPVLSYYLSALSVSLLALFLNFPTLVVTELHVVVTWRVFE